MIRLENVFEEIFAKRLEYVLKISWRRFCKTSSRLFEDVLKTTWQKVLKMLWRRLEDVLKTFVQDVLKTSWRILARRLEDVWPRRMYWSWPRHLEDVLKTKTDIFVLINTSSEDKDERHLQDVFIKTNVCLEGFKCFLA